MRRKAIAALLLALALLLTACAGGDITSEQVHLFYAARTETARGGDAITSIKARIPGWADMTTNERAEQVLERLLSGAAQGVGEPPSRRGRTSRLRGGRRDGERRLLRAVR